MRRPEQTPDPEVIATLEAIDTTLAGEPVDPAFAEVAELALLVAAERQVPDAEFLEALDSRVQRRYASSTSAAVVSSRRRRRPTHRWWWTLVPAVGVPIAAVVALVVLASGGATSGDIAATASRPAVVTRSGPRRTSVPANRTPSAHIPPVPRSAAPAPRRGALQTSRPGANSAPQSLPGLRLPSNGRQQVQSSQLTLGTPAKRIDTVAQEVFNVVGAQSGFVDSSTVNQASTGGYARFSLTVPSVSLPQTMSELSDLSYATVLQRTDTVEDVTSQYRNAVRHHDKAEVRALQRKVSYSQIAVNIQPDAPGLQARAPHHGFSIGGAAHTALRVLTVVGGIALIALAVLVPLAIVAAVAWWVVAALRHRGRERALDLA